MVVRMKRMGNNIVVVTSNLCPGCDNSFFRTEHRVFVPSENRFYHIGCYICKDGAKEEWDVVKDQAYGLKNILKVEKQMGKKFDVEKVNKVLDLKHRLLHLGYGVILASELTDEELKELDERVSEIETHVKRIDEIINKV